ncbi:MBL fold metallo-hydrolase [Chitinophaga oryzae]|uniref:MBL fold metallo-hydrolase n=1 Tax=Chitinophaga oryzae TaxID=2725414 RepID=A0AAE6ZF85_9BACT|nr:MBL fold metallo-hydrolase [Chitinophaga oryzae]QJB30482.1 MBL fold metallo-hydrolase [Chitinophaga oryzae]
MKDNLVYLKPNVVIEPLFDKWYAWAHLISPATAAMNLQKRHLKIMESYIDAPELHEEAARNPAMLGGPFMDYSENRVAEISGLRDFILSERKDLLDFAGAVQQLFAILKDHPCGYSLESLYKKVPDILKGYVELTVDLNNNPSFRFYEQALYKSKYYKEECQSIALYLIDKDERPFVLSTPRIEGEGVLHLPLAFKDKRIDQLFKMQRIPERYEAIREQFELTPEEDILFRNLFTEEPTVPYRKYTGSGVRTRYFGHACILTETREVSILTDPVISYGYDADVKRFTYTDLPDQIDIVFITHNHQDHILFETMLQLRHKARYIVVPRNGSRQLQDPSLSLMFREIGFENVIELDEFETITINNCRITGVPFIGEHCDLDIRTKLCYHVETGANTFLFAADCCNVEPKLFEHAYAFLGDIDIIFLGMECDGAPLSWLYGPLLPEPLSRDRDFSRRLTGSNYERAIDLVNRFHPKEVYIYAMGMEPWLKYIMSLNHTAESYPIIESNRLIQECLSRNINSERLFGEKEIVYK